MSNNTNRGGLWKSTANHYGRLDINDNEYQCKLWKLEGGQGLLVLTGDGSLNGEQIILYKSEQGKAILSGTVGTKDSKLGWVNVFRSDSTNEKAPALNLTFKPANGGTPTNAGSSATDF
jgi:hypothetical protein